MQKLRKKQVTDKSWFVCFPRGAHRGKEIKTGNGLGKWNRVQTGILR